MTITTGKYAGRTGTVDSNVFQRTVDYPSELSEGFHVMLDSGELVTVRWEVSRAFSAAATEIAK